jgi:hypothetical protein
MQAAGLDGVPASPKRLRHRFGVAVVIVGVPFNLVRMCCTEACPYGTFGCHQKPQEFVSD